MALACALCGGELRPIAITAEGQTESCPCGSMKITRLNKGELDLGIQYDAPGPEGEQPVREEL